MSNLREGISMKKILFPVSLTIFDSIVFATYYQVTVDGKTYLF
jgi:hypothetical protein